MTWQSGWKLSGITHPMGRSQTIVPRRIHKENPNRYSYTQIREQVAKYWKVIGLL